MLYQQIIDIDTMQTKKVLLEKEVEKEKNNNQTNKKEDEIIIHEFQSSFQFDK